MGIVLRDSQRWAPGVTAPMGVMAPNPMAPLVHQPLASAKIAEFRRITELHYYPDGIVPPDSRGETVILPPPPAAEPPQNPQDRDRQEDVAVQLAFRRDFDEMIAPYPLLRDAVWAIEYLVDLKQGRAPIQLSDSEAKLAQWATLDTQTLAIEARDQKATLDRMSAELRSFRETLKRLTIKAAEDQRGIDPLDDLEAYDRALNRLGVPEWERRIAQHERDIVSATAHLKGVVEKLVFQNGMLALSQGHSEDDVLMSAGIMWGTFGFNQDAMVHLRQAQEVAQKLHDTATLMQLELTLIRYNPDLDTTQKVQAYDRYVSLLDATTHPAAVDSALDGVEMNGILRRRVREAMSSQYAALRAEAVMEWVHLAANEAGDDVESEEWLRTQAVLDNAIEIATRAERPDVAEVAYLVRATAYAADPYILSAADAVMQARLELRQERLQPMQARVRRAEALFAHLKAVSSDAVMDPMVTNAMGVLGATTYFYAQQRTGFAYGGLCDLVNRVVPTYPESAQLHQILAAAQEAAPHLFDQGGRFLSPAQHRTAPDGARARAEVEMLNILPGSLPTQIAADYTTATLGAAAGAKGGTALCAALLAPEAIPVCAGVGAILGFSGGSAGGAAVIHAAYSDEIETLAHQAEMAGMKLAQLKEGAGNLEVFKALSFFGLTVALSPTGGQAAVRLANRLNQMMTVRGLKHVAKGIGEEFGQLASLGPTAWRGFKGFFGIAERNGHDLHLLPVAEQIARTLGVGKTTRANLDQAEALILGEARRALAANIQKAVGGESTELATQLATAFFPYDVINGSVKRLSRFTSLLDNVAGGLDQQRFVTKASQIFGPDSEAMVTSVSDYLYTTVGKSDVVSPKVLGQQLRNALQGNVNLDIDGLFGEVVKLLQIGNGEAEQLVSQITRSLGNASVDSLLRVSQLLKLEGTKAAQIECLLKDIVRDDASARSVLETMLAAPSREDFLRRAAASHFRVDPHATVGMLTDAQRARVREAVQKVLTQETTVRRLGTEEFFRALYKVDGMEEWLRSVATSTLDVATSEGRHAVIRHIASDSALSQIWVDRIMGKGLDKAALRKFSSDAKKQLFQAIVKPDVGVNRELQHAMKDVLRPTLSAWRHVDPWDIVDVGLRADYRMNQRILGQAHVLLDEEGQEFARGIMADIAPWRLQDLEPHLDAAVGMMQRDTRKTVVGQITKAMTYVPEDGVLDPLLRPLNDLYDGAWIGRIDRFLARRFGKAADAILAADPTKDLAMSPLLLRKTMLRNAFLAQQVAKNGGKVAAQGEVGPVLRALETAYNWMSNRLGTEEFRKAHRLCLPVAAADVVFDDRHEMSSGGVICAIVGSNYYLQKFGVGNTHALDIAMTQRTIGTALSKSDADSDNLLDIQRTGATAGEAVTSMVIQSFAMYGLNFAEKTGYGQVIGNLPLLRRIPLAMNSAPFFGFFKGSVAKPEFVIADGFWSSTKRIGFSTAMSTAHSFGIGWVFKNERLFNAGEDYPLVRGFNYAVNGAVVNTTGFTVNKALERNNPDADLRSTLRQLVERTLGTGTQYLAWKMGDTFAGKGEYKAKTDRLLREARVEGVDSNDTEAWQIFGRRWSFDVLGLWSGRDPDRRLRFNIFQSSVNLEQIHSWYTENVLEFPGKKKQQGYLVDKAKKDPDGLRELLRQFAVEIDDPKATWRSGVWPMKHAQARQIYYFSLIVKHFALAHQAGKTEYLPFAEFVAESPHKRYWGAVPSCETEADLQRAIVRMEDFEEVYRPKRVGGGESLEDILAILRASSHLQTLTHRPTPLPQHP